MLKVRAIKSSDEFSSIKSSWDEFIFNNDDYTVFQTWDWNNEWCKYVLSNMHSAQLHTLILEDEKGKLAAIIPLYQERIFGGAAIINQFLGNHLSCQNDIILADKNNKELIVEVLESLNNYIKYSSFLFLKHLDGNSKFSKILNEKNIAQAQYHRIVINNDPEIENQQKRFGKSTRKNYRWRENKLKRDYEINIVVR